MKFPYGSLVVTPTGRIAKVIDDDEMGGCICSTRTATHA